MTREEIVDGIQEEFRRQYRIKKKIEILTPSGSHPAWQRPGYRWLLRYHLLEHLELANYDGDLNFEKAEKFLISRRIAL